MPWPLASWPGAWRTGPERARGAPWPPSPPAMRSWPSSSPEAQHHASEALDAYRKSAVQFEAAGNRFGAAQAFSSTGRLQDEAYNYAESVEAYRKGLEHARASGSKDLTVLALEGLSREY